MQSVTVRIAEYAQTHTFLSPAKTTVFDVQVVVGGFMPSVLG